MPGPVPNQKCSRIVAHVPCHHSNRYRKDFGAWREHVARLRSDHPLDYDRESEAIQQEEVLQGINRLTRGEAIYATGVGQKEEAAALLQGAAARRAIAWPMRPHPTIPSVFPWIS